MFERFTDRARRVIVLAQDEARMLNHNYIGTEHILLGLINEEEGLAARALKTLGVRLDDTRRGVEDIIGRGAKEQKGHIPFTPRAKKVLELSLREALELNHDYIGTEHILLGLIREGDGVAAQVLVRDGVNLDRARHEVIRLLRGYAEARAGELRDRLASFADRLAVIERRLREAAPDVAPGSPDVAPGNPDAAPGSPDAAPGAPAAS